MRKIKSIIAVVSAAALMLGLGACNNNSSGGETKSLYSQGLELEPVHIKTASKIIAKVKFPKYSVSSLS